MTDLHTITNRALEQWILVTGVDPNEESPEFTWNNYEVGKLNEYIRGAQDLDPSGLTAYMVVRTVAQDYIGQQKFKTTDLVEEVPEAMERLAELRKLARLVENPDALTAVAEFQEQLREASEFYGVRAQVEPAIQDLHLLSHIRRDALICTTLLERHTFGVGARAKKPLQYNRNVIKLWNMNSLVRMAQAQPIDGISIVLVRDPNHVAYSYFCFLVRDGENITIWTDRPRMAHPLQKSMSRGRQRARQLQDRMAQARFPYQLLEIAFDDEGKHVREVIGSELVRTNVDAVAISPIDQLEPDQILWALMALDVLVRAEHSQKLSVTGENMTLALPDAQTPTRMLNYQEVTTEAINLQLDEYDRGTGAHAWMEERYGAMVDPRLFNLTDVAPKALSSSSWGSPEPSGNESHEMVLIGGERVDAMTLLPKARGVRHRGAHEGTDHVWDPHLIGLDPVDFGTPEEMEALRLWAARWNQAQALAMAAQAEFDARREEVCAWFESRVKQNAETILERIMFGAWDVDTGRTSKWDDKEEPIIDHLIKWYRKSDVGHVLESYEYWPSSHDTHGALFRKNMAPKRQNPHGCYVTGMSANCWVKLLPSSPEGIAALAGVSVKDLPELLQFWHWKKPSQANSILRRTDPLETAISNPWEALTFQVSVGLALREWKRRYKASGSTIPIPWQIKDQHGWVLEDHAQQ